MTLNRMDFGTLCPRYERCSAGFCPGLGGRHLPGEPVCALMREAVKTGGEARVRASIPSELAEAVVGHAQRLMRSTGALARELRRASRAGSQIEAGHRLANRSKEASTPSAQADQPANDSDESPVLPRYWLASDVLAATTAHQELATHSNPIT
jgi:hypothetical protein